MSTLLSRGQSQSWIGCIATLALLSGCTLAKPSAGAGGFFFSGWQPTCIEATERRPLPPEVPESSGAVRAYPTMPFHEAGFWTHNDSGWPGIIFRVDPYGRMLDRVRLAGVQPVDWEDMAAGPCPDGSRCLYLADTGDNRERRTELRIHRIPEPAPGDTIADFVTEVQITLPDGPRDIEAMVVLDHETVLLITKGRNHPVEVYMIPGPLERDTTEPRVPVRIQQLSSAPARMGELVVGGTTGAAAQKDGDKSWIVAIRSYEDLRFFQVAVDDAGTLLLEEQRDSRVNLRPLREAQGEGIAFLGDHLILLTSEAGLRSRAGSFQILRCRGL